LSVNVFSTKILIGNTIFTSPTGKESAICRAKEVPSFVDHFKTLSAGPVPVIEPLTSHFAVKPSTDQANPAAAAVYKQKIHVFYNET